LLTVKKKNLKKTDVSVAHKEGFLNVYKYVLYIDIIVDKGRNIEGVFVGMKKDS